MCNCNKTYNIQLGCSPQIKLANPNAYYDKEEIDEMLKDIEISGGCVCDVTSEDLERLGKSLEEVSSELGRLDYETDALMDRVNSKADRSDLANYQPKGDYVTEGSLEDKLSNYPTKYDINDLEERIEDLEVYDFEEFATKEWIEGQGYLTEHQHLKTINGESLVGEGNIEIKGGSEPIDAYTKEESDSRFGTLEEQKSLRNDVEQALGEAANNEAELQKKASKEELNALKGDIPTLQTTEYGNNKNYIYAANYIVNPQRTVISNVSIEQNASQGLILRKNYWGGTTSTTSKVPTVTNEFDGAMSASDKVKLDSMPTIWSGTKTEYDAIENKDANTLYLVYDS